MYTYLVFPVCTCILGVLYLHVLVDVTFLTKTSSVFDKFKINNFFNFKNSMAQAVILLHIHVVSWHKGICFNLAYSFNSETNCITV